MEEIIIKQRETKSKIIGIINEAKIPACMLTPILKDLYEEISSLEEQQYNIALQKQEEKKKKDKPKKESVKND